MSGSYVNKRFFSVVSAGPEYTTSVSTASTQFPIRTNTPLKRSPFHETSNKQESINSTEDGVSSTIITEKMNTRTDEQESEAVTPIAAGVGGTVILLLGVIVVVVFILHRYICFRSNREYLVGWDGVVG